MAEMGSAEANLFSAALSALIEWFTTALLPKYSALSQAQAGTWTAKLGGRRLEGADWRAQIGGRGKQRPYSAPFMKQSRVGVNSYAVGRRRPVSTFVEKD